MLFLMSYELVEPSIMSAGKGAEEAAAAGHTSPDPDAHAHADAVAVPTVYGASGCVLKRVSMSINRWRSSKNSSRQMRQP